jgi:hypothetical protein
MKTIHSGKCIRCKHPALLYGIGLCYACKESFK